MMFHHLHLCVILLNTLHKHTPQSLLCYTNTHHLHLYVIFLSIFISLVFSFQVVQVVFFVYGVEMGEIFQLCCFELDMNVCFLISLKFLIALAINEVLKLVKMSMVSSIKISTLWCRLNKIISEIG